MAGGAGAAAQDRVHLARRQRPGARNVTFDELRAAYVEQLNGLLDGGIDIVLIETIFDTPNAKAAIFAVEETFEARGVRLPVMISGTVTGCVGPHPVRPDRRGVLNSVRHARPVTIGLNCALGAALMRPYVAELSKICDTYVRPSQRRPAQSHGRDGL